MTSAMESELNSFPLTYFVPTGWHCAKLGEEALPNRLHNKKDLSILANSIKSQCRRAFNNRGSVSSEGALAKGYVLKPSFKKSCDNVRDIFINVYPHEDESYRLCEVEEREWLVSAFYSFNLAKSDSLTLPAEGVDVAVVDVGLSEKAIDGLLNGTEIDSSFEELSNSFDRLNAHPSLDLQNLRVHLVIKIVNSTPLNGFLLKKSAVEKSKNGTKTNGKAFQVADEIRCKVFSVVPLKLFVDDINGILEVYPWNITPTDLTVEILSNNVLLSFEQKLFPKILFNVDDKCQLGDQTKVSFSIKEEKLLINLKSEESKFEKKQLESLSSLDSGIGCEDPSERSDSPDETNQNICDSKTKSNRIISEKFSPLYFSAVQDDSFIMVDIFSKASKEGIFSVQTSSPYLVKLVCIDDCFDSKRMCLSIASVKQARKNIAKIQESENLPQFESMETCNLTIVDGKLSLKLKKRLPGEWDALWIGKSKKLKKVFLNKAEDFGNFEHLNEITNLRLPSTEERTPEVDPEQPEELSEKTLSACDDGNLVTIDSDNIDKDKIGTSGNDSDSLKFKKAVIIDKEESERDDVFEVNAKPPVLSTTRRRRCSESASRRSSPPVSGQPRGILKCRRRSMSESHIGSLEECLGEELLDKYDSVETALVTEYGCLEGLLEECGWEEEESDSVSVSNGSKKTVRFNDIEKMHLFMSKTSIVNQLANDDKKSMRQKMKEHKKQMRIERRQAQKTGRKFNSGYKNNSGYNSFDDCTTDESEGGEFLSSSSCSETTDTSDSEASDTKTQPKTDPESFAQHRRNRSFNKKGGKSKRKVELTNNMIFQLDMES